MHDLEDFPRVGLRGDRVLEGDRLGFLIQTDPVPAQERCLKNPVLDPEVVSRLPTFNTQTLCPDQSRFISQQTGVLISFLPAMDHLGSEGDPAAGWHLL